MIMFPKENAWRSNSYIKWLKLQPSIISGLPADDPHHIKGHGFGGSVKAPDWAVLPLTRDEHTELHGPQGIEAWEERHGSQVDLLMRFWLMNFDTIKGYLK